MTNRSNNELITTIVLVDRYYDEFRSTGKRIGAIDHVIKMFKKEQKKDISRSYVTYCRSAGNLLRATGSYQLAQNEHWGTKEMRRLREQVANKTITMSQPIYGIEDIKEQTVHEIEEELSQTKGGE